MAAVAALVFWLGYDGGAYALESRTTLAIGVIWTAAIAVALGLWPARQAASSSARRGRAAGGLRGLHARLDCLGVERGEGVRRV